MRRANSDLAGCFLFLFKSVVSVDEGVSFQVTSCLAVRVFIQLAEVGVKLPLVYGVNPLE